MKVFFATPLYAQIESDTVASVERVRDAIRERGDAALPWRFSKGTLVHESRNSIVDWFLKSDAHVLVQFDQDHVFLPDPIVDAIDFVASGESDVCGFAYPFRHPRVVSSMGNLTSPRLFLGERPAITKHGRYRYLEVFAVGAGILITSRRAIEKSAERAEYTHHGRRTVFDMRCGVGEDIYFCTKWRKELGGKVHCAMDADIGHIGTIVHHGNLDKELESFNKFNEVRMQPAMTKLLPEVTEEGSEDPETLELLARYG
jgi:hypothetical protein